VLFEVENRESPIVKFKNLVLADPGSDLAKP